MGSKGEKSLLMVANVSEQQAAAPDRNKESYRQRDSIAEYAL
jgi:hypothetical protein